LLSAANPNPAPPPGIPPPTGTAAPPPGTTGDEEAIAHEHPTVIEVMVIHEVPITKVMELPTGKSGSTMEGTNGNTTHMAAPASTDGRESDSATANSVLGVRRACHRLSRSQHQKQAVAGCPQGQLLRLDSSRFSFSSSGKGPLVGYPRRKKLWGVSVSGSSMRKVVGRSRPVCQT
jgi:hypothetical protein